MVLIYVKTSTSTINVANHRAKGGWCDINFLTFKKEGGGYTLRGGGYTLAFPARGGGGYASVYCPGGGE